jgi:hypothetical protein
MYFFLKPAWISNYFMKYCLISRNFQFHFAKFREIQLRNFGEISRNKIKISRNTKVIFSAKFRIAKFRIHPRLYSSTQYWYNWQSNNFQMELINHALTYTGDHCIVVITEKTLGLAFPLMQWIIFLFKGLCTFWFSWIKIEMLFSGHYKELIDVMKSSNPWYQCLCHFSFPIRLRLQVSRILANKLKRHLIFNSSDLTNTNN